MTRSENITKPEKGDIRKQFSTTQYSSFTYKRLKSKVSRLALYVDENAHQDMQILQKLSSTNITHNHTYFYKKLKKENRSKSTPQTQPKLILPQFTMKYFAQDILCKPGSIPHHHSPRDNNHRNQLNHETTTSVQKMHHPLA